MVRPFFIFFKIVSFVSFVELFHIISNKTPNPINGSSFFSSIEVVIDPVTTNYYYFVADKNRKIYFSKTIEEHNNTIGRLKSNNLWYDY